MPYDITNISFPSFQITFYSIYVCYVWCEMLARLLGCEFEFMLLLCEGNQLLVFTTLPTHTVKNPLSGQ